MGNKWMPDHTIRDRFVPATKLRPWVSLVAGTNLRAWFSTGYRF